MQTNQKELIQTNAKSEAAYTAKNPQKDILSRLQNTSHITHTSNMPESAQRKESRLKQSDRQTIFSETQTYTQKASQFSDDKQHSGKKLNFYNQMSPASEVLSQFKDSQMISAFKNQDDDEACCMEDESIVIIQEDQLRMPLRSSKQSQNTQSSQKFIFDDEIMLSQQKHQEQIEQQQPYKISKEDLILQSMESDRSIFKKKHETSVIEQESLVTQIKTQLMKIQFQQAFQGGDGSKTKRQRNIQNKDCQTMRDCEDNKFKVDLDNSHKQSMQGSGTFYFEPQFDDLSFEIDTCNQIRVPKNMPNPIDQAKIMSLPYDLEIYQEHIDPATGKVKFTVDQNTVKILNQNVRKANIMKPENQIISTSVQQFPDPLNGKLKQDFNSRQEEKQEEQIIQKELETTMNAALHSLCSSNNYSLNTFLSEDVSLNSNLIQQVMNNQSNNNIAAGILIYAANKLNVREGDPLFLLPRLNDKMSLQLKLALLKREPEWQLGNELSVFGGGQKRNDNDPQLETFMF